MSYTSKFFSKPLQPYSPNGFQRFHFQKHASSLLSQRPTTSSNFSLPFPPTIQPKLTPLFTIVHRSVRSLSNMLSNHFTQPVYPTSYYPSLPNHLSNLVNRTSFPTQFTERVSQVSLPKLLPNSIYQTTL